MNKRSFELFVALRHLRSKRQSGLLSVITYIAIAGVVIGVAALTIVLSVMNGYESEVRSRFISMGSHVKVKTFHDRGFSDRTTVEKTLQAMPEVEAFTPYIEGKGLIKFKSHTTGIVIQGMETATAGHVVDLSRCIIQGAYDLKNSGILMGVFLAEKLSVQPGDTILVASYMGNTSLWQMPQMMKFHVNGIFKTGLFGLDDNLTYIDLADAQKLFLFSGKIGGLEVRLRDYQQAEAVAEQIRQRLGYPYQAVTWLDINPNLFAWMKMQKWAAFIVLSLIIIVATFNIVSILIMITMEKKIQIGVLKSLGASSRQIQRIFTLEGLFVGVFGALLGSAIGYGLCGLQQSFKFLSLPPDVYIISWLPVLMRWSDFFTITLITVALAWLASVYPAMRASRLNPVEALRNE
jgi:lipoprotein-releasing system permease protein